MPSLDIKDYVNLHLNASTKTGDGFYEWTIPASYYSNKYSSVCTVHVVVGSVLTEGVHNDAGLYINYLNGATNTMAAGTTHPYEHPVLSHLHPMGRGNPLGFHSDVPQCKLLVNARPEIIRLGFMDSHQHGAKGLAGGLVTMCFEYYDSDDTSRQFHEQFTRTLPA